MINNEPLETLLNSISPKHDMQKRFKAFSYNLAHAVMQKLSIENNRTLIAILGEGDEYSNHQALVHWMLDRYSSDSFEEMENVIDTVSKDLHLYLDAEFNDGGFSC